MLIKKRNQSASAKKWRDANIELARRRGMESYRRHAEARKAYARKARRESDGFISLRRAAHSRGLTIDQFHALYENQDFSCKICSRVLIGFKSIHVDHDHKTNRVRGLLCANCNTGIGLFKDSVDLLVRASEYISCSR